MTTASKVWTEKFAQMSHGRRATGRQERVYRPSCCMARAGTRAAKTGRCHGPSVTAASGFCDGLPELGSGDVFDQEFSFAYLVDHVREFMSLGIDSANVRCHSMGGWILTLLSYESPDRVRKAVNVAAAARHASLAEHVESRCRRPRHPPALFTLANASAAVSTSKIGRPVIAKLTCQSCRRLRQSHAPHDQSANSPALQYANDAYPSSSANAGGVGSERSGQLARELGCR